MSYYQQIANILRAQIVNTRTSEPVPLPSGRDLTRIHGVTRGTIHRALASLADEGLIVVSHGRATMTNPKGIRLWQQLRHDHPIVVITGRDAAPERPQTYFGQIYQGVLDASAEARYSCVCRPLGYMFPMVGKAGGSEDPERILGVIMIDIRDERLIAMHVEAGYPVVCVDHTPGHPHADSVSVDCFVEAQQAVAHLVSLGHRELLYLGNVIGHGRQRHIETDSLLMEAGYRRAVELAGLTSSAGRIRQVFTRPAEVQEAVAWIVGMRPRPTAGLVFDSATAREVLEALADRGVRCPEDISIISKRMSLDTSSTTSLCADAAELGRCAVDLLLRRVSGKARAGTRITLTSQLRRGPSVRSLPL